MRDLKTFFHTSECALISGTGPCDCGGRRKKTLKTEKSFVNGVWTETEEEKLNWESI